jgi:hypothetical protein
MVGKRGQKCMDSGRRAPMDSVRTAFCTVRRAVLVSQEISHAFATWCRVWLSIAQDDERRVNDRIRHARVGQCGGVGACARWSLGREDIRIRLQGRPSGDTRMGEDQWPPAVRVDLRFSGVGWTPARGQMGTVERVPMGQVDVSARGRGWPPGGAPMVAFEPMSLGRMDVRIRGRGWTPGGAPMVAFERLPMGRTDVCVRGRGWPSGSSQVGTCEWMPMGFAHV